MLRRRLWTTLRNPILPAKRICRPYTSPSKDPTSRISRLESRLPRFLSRFITPLRNAPISHITAFLVLHEITAILPLVALAGVFHYTHWLPPFISEGKWISDGVEKFGRYFRRKGWISSAQETEAEAEVEGAGKDRGLGKMVKSKSGLWWGRGEEGVRLVVEVATAYAITKALLPLRLIISVWATPWFARWSVLPLTRWVKRTFGRGKAPPTPAAGTGAVAGGALPKKSEIGNDK